MTYDIIGQCVQSAPPPPLAAPAAAAASLLPRRGRLAPALAETLALNPLRLCDGRHPGTAPAVAPHPDVHLIEPAAVAPVPLRVGGGVSKTRIVLEAVRNSGVTVAADEAVQCHLPSCKRVCASKVS